MWCEGQSSTWSWMTRWAQQLQLAKWQEDLSTWRPFTLPMSFFLFFLHIGWFTTHWKGFSEQLGETVEKSMNLNHYCATWFVDLLICWFALWLLTTNNAGLGWQCWRVSELSPLGALQPRSPPFNLSTHWDLEKNIKKNCLETKQAWSKHTRFYQISDLRHEIIPKMRMIRWVIRWPEIVRYSCCWRNLFASAVFGRTWPTAWRHIESKIHGLVLLLQALRYEKIIGWYTGVTHD